MTLRAVLVAMSLAALAAAPPLAAAEQAKPPTAKPKGAKPKGAKPNGGKLGPRRAQMTRLYAARHGAWVLQCFRNAQKRILCNMGQVRTYKVGKTARKKIKGPPRLVLMIQGATVGESVIFISPTGWYKESRILARVDRGFSFGLDAPPKRNLAPITPADSKKIIDKFKAGQVLMVKFYPGVGDVQEVRFSLAGFTAAVNAMRAVIARYAKTEPKRVTRPAPGATKPKDGGTKK